MSAVAAFFFQVLIEGRFHYLATMTTVIRTCFEDPFQLLFSIWMFSTQIIPAPWNSRANVCDTLGNCLGSFIIIRMEKTLNCLFSRSWVNCCDYKFLTRLHLHGERNTGWKSIKRFSWFWIICLYKFDIQVILFILDCEIS